MAVKGRVVYVLPVAPPGAPKAVRRALEMRLDASLDGRCPKCGAQSSVNVAALAQDPPGGVQPPAVLLHEDVCPASDEFLVRILREHGMGPEDLPWGMFTVDHKAPGR